jgi:hypothetical protein
MRFHLGPIPKTESDELPLGEWTPLRHDFGPLVMQLFAWPIGGIAFVIVGWLWLHETSAMKHLGNNPRLLAFVLVVAMLALIPVHEFLHALIHPRFGMSRKTVLGAWPTHLLFYAHYDGPMSRERLATCTATPFLIMTVAPLLISIIAGHASIVIAFVSTVNALASGADIFAVGTLLWQVPRRTKIFNQGWRTYWSRTISK